MIQPVSFQYSQTTFRAKVKIPFTSYYDPTCPHITNDILESMKNYKSPTERLMEKVTAPMKKLAERELPDPNNISNGETISHILPSGDIIGIMADKAANGSERFEGLMQAKDLLDGRSFPGFNEGSETVAGSIDKIAEHVGNVLDAVS